MEETLKRRRWVVVTERVVLLVLLQISTPSFLSLSHPPIHPCRQEQPSLYLQKPTILIHFLARHKPSHVLRAQIVHAKSWYTD